MQVTIVEYGKSFGAIDRELRLRELDCPVQFGHAYEAEYAIGECEEPDMGKIMVKHPDTGRDWLLLHPGEYELVKGDE